MYLGDTVGQPPKKGPAQNDEIAVAVDHPIPSPVGLFQLGSNSGENRNFFFLFFGITLWILHPCLSRYRLSVLEVGVHTESLPTFRRIR